MRQKLPLTPVELASLLRSMTKTYPNLQPSAADISIEFNQMVVGDGSLLTQCFGNLLDDAVKFVAARHQTPYPGLGRGRGRGARGHWSVRA